MIFSKKKILVIILICISSVSLFPIAWPVARALFSAFIKEFSKEAVCAAATAITSKKGHETIDTWVEKVEQDFYNKRSSIVVPGNDSEITDNSAEPTLVTALKNAIVIQAPKQTEPIYERQDKDIPFYFPSPSKPGYQHKESYYLQSVTVSDPFESSSVPTAQPFDIGNIKLGSVGDCDVSVGTDYISLILFTKDAIGWFCDLIANHIKKHEKKPFRTNVAHVKLDKEDAKFFSQPLSENERWVMGRINTFWMENDFEPDNFQDFLFQQYHLYQYPAYQDYVHRFPAWRAHVESLINKLEQNEDLDFKMRGVEGFKSTCAPVVDYTQALISQIGKFSKWVGKKEKNPFHLSPSRFLMYLRDEELPRARIAEQITLERLEEGKRYLEYKTNQELYTQNVANYSITQHNKNQALYATNTKLFETYSSDFQNFSLTDGGTTIRNDNGSEIVPVAPEQFSQEEEFILLANEWVDLAAQKTQEKCFSEVERLDQRLSALYSTLMEGDGSHFQIQVFQESNQLAETIITSYTILGSNLYVKHMFGLAAQASCGASNYMKAGNLHAGYAALDLGYSLVSLAEKYSSLTLETESKRHVSVNSLSHISRGIAKGLEETARDWKNFCAHNSHPLIKEYIQSLENVSNSLARLIIESNANGYRSLSLKGSSHEAVSQVTDFITNAVVGREYTYDSSIHLSTMLNEELRTLQLLMPNASVYEQKFLAPLSEIIQQTFEKIEEKQKEIIIPAPEKELPSGGEGPDPDEDDSPDDPEFPKGYRKLISALLAQTYAIIKGRKYTKHAIERAVPPVKKVIEEFKNRARKLFPEGSKQYQEYLDKNMQPRGVSPKTIEETIKNGIRKTQNCKTPTCHHKNCEKTIRIKGNDATVVINEKGDVVTLWGHKTWHYIKN